MSTVVVNTGGTIRFSIPEDDSFLFDPRLHRRNAVFRIEASSTSRSHVCKSQTYHNTFRLALLQLGSSLTRVMSSSVSVSGSCFDIALPFEWTRGSACVQQSQSIEFTFLAGRHHPHCAVGALRPRWPTKSHPPSKGAFARQDRTTSMNPAPQSPHSHCRK